MNKHITEETHGPVRLLRIDRAEAMNALTREMLEGLREGIARAGKDETIRAILLVSTGRAFSVGADLNDPMMGFDLPPEKRADACRETLGGLMNGLIRDIASCPVPVITAVNGICAGGGVGLALAADMVVAAQSAKFLIGFVPVLGLTPDLGTTWQLTRKLGRSRALGLAMTGRDIPAEDAERWGLIWQTVADDALESETMALAQQLASGPNEAQIALRELIDAAGENTLSDQLDYECELQARRTASQEVAEAVSAFLGKRKPDFISLGRKPG